jgi:hypothetical protein
VRRDDRQLGTDPADRCLPDVRGVDRAAVVTFDPPAWLVVLAILAPLIVAVLPIRRRRP